MSAEEIARRVRTITEEKAKESNEELKELPCAKKPDLKRQGNKAIDYFSLNIVSQQKQKKTSHF